MVMGPVRRDTACTTCARNESLRSRLRSRLGLSRANAKPIRQAVEVAALESQPPRRFRPVVVALSDRSEDQLGGERVDGLAQRLTRGRHDFEAARESAVAR